MTDNIFMVSDASYSSDTKCAGLGVIDLHTGKKYSHSVCNIEDSSMAEYRALFLSVQIAINNSYDNVVFVYDNKELNLDTLKLWLIGKIDSYQFLWLKRVFVDDADKIARKARHLQEKILKSKKRNLILDDNNLLLTFKEYPTKKIIKAFLVIATKADAKILRLFIDDKSYSLTKIDKDSINFYIDIYNFITKEKDKKRFLKFIKQNYTEDIEIEKLQVLKDDEHYLIIIKNIIKKLNSINLILQKREQDALLSLSKEERAERLIVQLQNKPYREMMLFCLRMATDKNKKFLRDYMNSKLVREYTISEEDIELYLLIHYLLSKKQKKPFFGFINNRLKQDKKLSSLFYVRDKEFYLNYLLQRN